MDKIYYGPGVGALVAAAVLLLALSACDRNFLSGVKVDLPPPPHYDPEGATLEDATDTFTTRYTQRTDILAVIDNSGSMAEERAAVKSAMGDFHAGINAARLNDYRLAITTTDAYSTEGSLISYNGVDIVTSDSKDPVGDVQGILDAIGDSPKSYWEQGLKAAERALVVNGSRFLRASTDLAVIYVSDEEDYSCLDSKGSPAGRDCPGLTSSTTAPESFADPKPWAHVGLDYYKMYLQSLGRTVLVYSIVGTAARHCEEVTKGQRYQTLQEMMGTGFTASICNDQLSDNFVRIAREISARGDCYPLAHPAVSEPADMEVRLAGTLVPFSQASGFYYEASTNAVCFSGGLLPPAGETLTVDYVWAH